MAKYVPIVDRTDDVYVCYDREYLPMSAFPEKCTIVINPVPETDIPAVGCAFSAGSRSKFKRGDRIFCRKQLVSITVY